MPLIHDPNAPPEAFAVGIGREDKPDPSFIDTLGAAYRYDNLIAGGLTAAQFDVPHGEFYRVDPQYNPFDDIEGYEQYSDRFETSYNPKATAAIKAAIDRENKDKDTLARSGMMGVVLSMVAGVTDPTILVPGGAFVKSARVGYSALKSAAAVGTAAAVGVGIQEAGLHAVQQTRTAGETAMALGGSAILGGLIGAAGAKLLTKGEWARLSKGIEEELAEEAANPAEIAETIVQRMQSAGAATVDDVDLSDLGVGGPAVARAVAAATDAVRINPGVSMMFSPSKEARKAYAQMVDNSIYTKMNMEGRTLGPDIENLVKMYERGATGEWIRGARKGYKDAKRAGFNGTRDDFMARVARAGRRGDVDELGNEFVTRAAQDARTRIFDPILEKAKEARLLPDDVKVSTAASYVTRYWNRQRLIGEESRFREIARDWLMRELRNVPPAERPDFVSRADMEGYVDEVVSSIFNNLTGRGQGDVPEWIVPARRGPLKERTFNIPDELIEDFLENDMELILRRYTRTVPAEIELANKFGSPDMKDTLKAIRDEYAQLRKQAAGKPRVLKELESREARDITSLEAFRDMLRGTYRTAEESSAWGKITRAALTWNYIRLLGGVTLSSASDAARIIGVHGMRATMREALPALVSSTRAAKIARSDARVLGPASETIWNSRLATLMELNDPYRYGSRYERFLSNTSQLFSKATGLSLWNDFWKTLDSVLTQNFMARTALDWRGARAQDRAHMALLFFDDVMADRIATQIRRHGVQENGIWGVNATQWDDEGALRVWAAAMNKGADRTIVTKGIADQPLWSRTNTGKMIMQFKSFGVASHQKVLISGLQGDQHRLAEMLALATPIGMMVSYLKFIERGDTEQAERLLNNPGLWIANGLDRTGFLSIPFEISNTMEKLGAPVGIMSASQAIAGDKDRGGTVSRYASRNKLGAVLGPSAGLFNDLTTIAAQLSQGDLKKSGANAMIRQVPGATLPGVRTGVHLGLKPWLQEAVN